MTISRCLLLSPPKPISTIFPSLLLNNSKPQQPITFTTNITSKSIPLSFFVVLSFQPSNQQISLLSLSFTTTQKRETHLLSLELTAPALFSFIQQHPHPFSSSLLLSTPNKPNPPPSTNRRCKGLRKPPSLLLVSRINLTTNQYH